MMMTNDVRRILALKPMSGKKTAVEHRCCSPEADEAKNTVKKEVASGGDASPRGEVPERTE